ncbi:hypothetical protein BU26DRAFT_119310 [Trematosphaeria pertusa]|uniref:Uncharacterized protein n=1 Tax=Trematosphaeria pertusa TaxID=390896 RepID=A0A6A6I1U5_9PLEO|nr:uncharacterized protein BU26DRAFT_119310 [Trematosphaeria pertusa]KAF2243550.1 hypothetical protein BU26DRAFT_119310 [Trematosphaeria pertusa]
MTGTPDQVEEARLRLRAMDKELFSEPNLRALLKGLPQIKRKDIEKSVNEISSLLGMHRVHCRMRIGHNEHQDYMLKPCTFQEREHEDDDDSPQREEILCFTNMLEEMADDSSSTTHAFLMLGNVFARPRGTDGDWVDIKTRLCLQLLDDAGGEFWILEKGTQEDTFTATWVAEDFDGLREEVGINCEDATKLRLKGGIVSRVAGTGRLPRSLSRIYKQRLV